MTPHGVPTEEKGLPQQTLQEKLERASEGLLKTSESDYPLRYFHLPAEGAQDLTPEGFARRLGISDQFADDHKLSLKTLVEQRPLDGFFPSAELIAGYHGEPIDSPKVKAEAKRWNDLATLLKHELKGVTVLRVGTIEIRCYVVGLCPKGNLNGLVTTVIET